MADADIAAILQADRDLQALYQEADRRVTDAEARGDTQGADAAKASRSRIVQAQRDLAIDGLRGLAAKLKEFRAELDAAAARARAWPNIELSPTQPTGPSSEPGGTGDVPETPPVAEMDQSEPSPSGPPSDFIKARKIAAKSILYIDREGREIVKEAGSRSWRNNNPGNIRKGNFAIVNGAIGDDGAFAIFPDVQTGLDAIVTLLRSKSYVDLSLKDAVFRYAPPNENNSDQYAASLESGTGIALNIVLSTLSINDIRKVAKVIQKIEGWHEGIEKADTPASETSTAGAISSAAGAAQDWMDIAKREAALPEHERSQWNDPGENPRILNYFKVGCSWFDPAGGDEVDWCAAFINYCLVTAGYIGTNHPGARSFFWNKKNQFVKLVQPRYGAVAVRRYAPFADPKWETGEGHVGFVYTSTPTSVTLLGGNQTRTVKLQTYPLVSKDAAGNLTAEFVAFMMPALN